MPDPNAIQLVHSPDDGSLDLLFERLSENASQWRTTDDWPRESLAACAQAGVFRWFFEKQTGGFEWSQRDQTRGYLKLSEADLVTTFIITQYMGAIRRILGSDNQELIERWGGPLMSGDVMGTVGISHLTTSSRHLANPILAAKPVDDGFVLNGLAPWVTGAPHADVLVIGATLDNGRELLAAVPSDCDGVVAGLGANLVALSSSCTDRVEFHDVRIDNSMLISGPIENVMQSGVGARTGGLQTSTLAIGLARAAANYLRDESAKRDDLTAIASEFIAEVDDAESLLLGAVSGDVECDSADMRGTVNRLALRCTQAAMTAAKGAGFVEGHPVGRWCRQAMFFLVWSCPRPVAQAHLCELAGIE